MAPKIACGPSKLTLGGPAGDSHTVISPINEIRKSRPLKDCKGPLKMILRAQKTLSNFLLILTAGTNTSSVAICV